MLNRVRSISYRVTITLFLAVSLLSAGLAHREMPNVADAKALQIMTDLGLTTADLCATRREGGGKMSTDDCPACHLAAAMVLSKHLASLKDIELRFAAVVLVTAEARVYGCSTNPAAPARAPPLA